MKNKENKEKSWIYNIKGEYIPLIGIGLAVLISALGVLIFA